MAAQGHPGRRGWFHLDVGLAVVVVVWSLALVAVVLTRDDGPEFSDAPADPVMAAVPAATEPPTAREIIEDLKVETGFTPGEVVACAHPVGDATGFYPSDAQCDPEHRDVIGESVSYGIVVENTGDHVIRGGTLSYQFLDDEGDPIPAPLTVFSPSDVVTNEASLPELEPGERFGLGNAKYLEHNEIADLVVEIGEPREWTSADHHDHVELPSRASRPGYDPWDLTVADIEVSYGESGEPIVSYTIESHQSQATEVSYAYAIFRDADGRIVGGAYGNAGPDSLAAYVPAHGSAEGEISVRDPMEVPDLDADQTELYISPTFNL